MYESAYKVNKENGRTVIELALNNYNEFFHEWDNASYKKKRLASRTHRFSGFVLGRNPDEKGTGNPD